MSTLTAQIRRLPPAVADAIAAGEVIERPASVLKELCENALDAGARRIEVDIESGGLVRIAVLDDGCGIAAAELPLAVSRHATSKIESERDLERIETLGFRGEALASIAAVSELGVTSRVDGVDAAAMIRVRAGALLESGAAAAPPGTCVEVLELFSATPARLRFMREARTEAAFASRMIGELALSRPEVAFACRSDGRQTLRTNGTGRTDAARSVFGPAAAGQLIEVRSAGDVRVEGLISAPLVHRGTRAGLVIVLNGRRVHNRSLLVAVEEAYRGLLPQGRHPFGLVVIDVDPAMVDVNVHPTKREVRFREERSVFTAVQQACWSALRAHAVLPVAGAGTDVFVTPHSGASPATLSLEDADDASEPQGAPGVALAQLRERSGASADTRAPLRAVGQVRGEWIVAEAATGIVLIDPHAAHEKVLYVELLEQWTRGIPGATSSQLLLLPVVIECDPVQMSRYESNPAFLESCGLVVEAFGPGLVRCTAVPASAAASDAARIVLGVLDSLDEDSPPAVRRHRAAALIACHAAVRFGDRLSLDQQQRLLERLGTTPGNATCPHGRPTMLTFADDQLRRSFRRSSR